MSTLHVHPTSRTVRSRLMSFLAAKLHALGLSAAAVLFAASAAPALASVPAAELAVLEALYAQTNGAAWDFSDDWLNGDPCESDWYGITCDGGNTMILEISLSYNNLSGPLPTDLKNLSNMTYFSARNNRLTGTLPSLTGMANLQVFDVSENFLEGSIAPLTGLPSLKQLILYKNKISGSIPSLSGLASLEYFRLHDNRFSDSIPSVVGLSELAYFRVDGNQLTGVIPPLTGLDKLWLLGVANNQLTGSLPDRPLNLQRALLCPNYLNPVSAPPTANDVAWNEVANDADFSSVSPWSTGCTAAPLPATPIPTLSQWGLMLLSALMAIGMLLVLRRRA